MFVFSYVSFCVILVSFLVDRGYVVLLWLFGGFICREVVRGVFRYLSFYGEIIDLLYGLFNLYYS